MLRVRRWRGVRVVGTLGDTQDEDADDTSDEDAPSPSSARRGGAGGECSASHRHLSVRSVSRRYSARATAAAAVPWQQRRACQRRDHVPRRAGRPHRPHCGADRDCQRLERSVERAAPRRDPLQAGATRPGRVTAAGGPSPTARANHHTTDSTAGQWPARSRPVPGRRVRPAPADSPPMRMRASVTRPATEAEGAARVAILGHARPPAQPPPRAILTVGVASKRSHLQPTCRPTGGGDGVVVDPHVSRTIWVTAL